jgi:hypothetical protein
VSVVLDALARNVLWERLTDEVVERWMDLEALESAPERGSEPIRNV